MTLSQAVASGDSSAAEIQASIVVRAPMLTKYPSSAFTKRSVTAAAMKFKFWPSVAELAGFLDDWSRPKGGEGGGEVGWPRKLRSAQFILDHPARYSADMARWAAETVAAAPAGSVAAAFSGQR